MLSPGSTIPLVGLTLMVGAFRVQTGGGGILPPSTIISMVAFVAVQDRTLMERLGFWGSLNTIPGRRPVRHPVQGLAPGKEGPEVMPNR